MRLATAFLLLAAGGVCGQAAAQSIFNVSPAQPHGTQRPAVIPANPAAPVGTISPPAQTGLQPSSSLVDPKVMAQFDQLPNESNDAYLVRLKALSQRAVADMERVSREHNAKMKALAPK